MVISIAMRSFLSHSSIESYLHIPRMKTSSPFITTMTSYILFLSILALAHTAPHQKRDSVYGFDISHYQSSVDFDAAYNDGGLRFVYIKATEGLTYKDPAFSDHYDGATSAGFIRGGYHFAHGDESASDQASFFYENGGGWTDDGITLPGKCLLFCEVE
jgi:GH25 family lysozyme M1 (1,4-beta-N-acetylmuramidase)